MASKTLKLGHFFFFSIFIIIIILLANSEMGNAQLCELMTNVPCYPLDLEMCNKFCWSELSAASGLCVSDVLGPQCLCIIDCD